MSGPGPSKYKVQQASLKFANFEPQKKYQHMASLTAMFDPENESAPGHYGSSQTALLLLDFHSAFIEKAGGRRAAMALQVAAKMRIWAKSRGIHIIHCLIDFNATPHATCKDAQRLLSGAETMRLGGAGEPSELLTGAEDDATFTRKLGYVSARKSPGLDDFLRKNGIRSLILAGLSTSGCVMRTALAATDAEYVVTAISDACADRDEDLHDVVLGKILKNRGYVVTAVEFQEGFVEATIGR
ncbi:MAG: hypothetical protein M1820_007620 [Bogoriella megaspora]|nr:MAG: hypothetical protein M1820_007620 [Bogoriella megaspora]